MSDFVRDMVSYFGGAHNEMFLCGMAERLSGHKTLLVIPKTCALTELRGPASANCIVTEVHRSSNMPVM